MLWIPFCSGRNGRKISYQSSDRYESPSCSTSAEIPLHFGPFQSFRPVLVNFGRNINFDRYWYNIMFTLLSVFYKLNGSRTHPFTAGFHHVDGCRNEPRPWQRQLLLLHLLFLLLLLSFRPLVLHSILNFLCLHFVFSFLFCEPSTWLGVGNDKETWQQVFGFVYVGSHLIYK